jgi:two-component system OmpR family sensor kinase
MSAASAPPRTGSGPQRLTLTARLVLLLVSVVALAALLLSVATTVALSSVLHDQLDGQVRAALQRAYGEATAPPGAPSFTGPDEAGQRVGTITALFSGDLAAGKVLVDSGDGPARAEQVSAEVLAELREVPADRQVHEVRLPGLGDHRVLASGDDRARVVAALPTADVDATLASLVRWEVFWSLLVVLVAGGAGAVLVNRSLSPLREVAATADRVTSLPLDRGEIEVTARVPERLTDERTEVGRVGAALNDLLEHVESSLSARHHSEQQVRRFVADASHELRTPLATISGYTELATRQPESTPTALAKVTEETARMAALVEDLLLLARLDQGRPLAHEPVDVTMLLAEVVNDARVLAPEHRWQLALPDEPLVVEGDPARLRQVVTNLVTNARLHTPPGTTVRVTGLADGFEVADDGPGMPPGLAEHAFDRFVRGDDSRTRRSATGSGLGLSLVRSIVEAHGGSVTMTTGPAGTRCVVRLRPGTAHDRL